MIFFVHTPKTSGTTFEAIIAQNIRSEKMGFFYPLRKEIVDFEGEVKDSMEINFKNKGHLDYDFIVGHFTYGMHRFFNNKDYRYIATIRNPFKHCVSLYKAFRRMSPGYQAEILNGKENLFENFISLPAYRNMQTFFISGLAQKQINDNESDAFRKTTEIIAQDYLGFIFPDHFNRSLLLINRELRFRHLYYKKKNVAANRVQLPDGFEAIIQKYNTADLMLYDYLKKNFLLRPDGPGAYRMALYSLKNRIKNCLS